MRTYYDKEKKNLEKVFCNRCGKELRVENGVLTEGCFEASPAFGYFSRRDGDVCRFDLCETCFDELLASFQLPCEVEEQKEYL